MCVWWAVVMIAELTVESREAEHADLLGDVVPGSWRPQTLELFLQLGPHQQDPVSHGLHIVLPAAKHKETSHRQLTWSWCSDVEGLGLGSGFCATNHSANSSGEFSVMATTRAPWAGGLDHVVLTIFSIWDRILFRLSASRVTMVRFPTRSSDSAKTFQQQFEELPLDGDNYKDTTSARAAATLKLARSVFTEIFPAFPHH